MDLPRDARRVFAAMPEATRTATVVVALGLLSLVFGMVAAVLLLVRLDQALPPSGSAADARLRAAVQTAAVQPATPTARPTTVPTLTPAPTSAQAEPSLAAVVSGSPAPTETAEPEETPAEAALTPETSSPPTATPAPPPAATAPRRAAPTRTAAPTRAAAPTPVPAAATRVRVKAAADNLPARLRQRPALDAPIVARVPIGATLEVLGQEPGPTVTPGNATWLRVRWQAMTGYVHASLVG